MEKGHENLRVQKFITGIAVLLLFIKLVAWYITSSVSILTDALESIVNVVTAFIGIYSLYISSKPKDYNHPYGHGKAEFLSAALEGLLIIIAGLLIIYEAIYNLWFPHDLVELDYGIIMVTITAAVNFITGVYAVRTGRRNDSPALIASGKHLQSDTYSTLGIIAGLLLITFTRLVWIDSVVALLFACIIIYTGFKILRTSVSGIMDEADERLLGEVVEYLNARRSENWIDLHNLRIIRYGSVLHLDCHLTVPWFLNVNEAHKEVDALSSMIRQKYGSSVELFVHTDGCMDFSCRICSKENCTVRKHAFVQRIEWNVDNISQDRKHGI